MYRKQIKEVVRILNGDIEKLVHTIRKQMQLDSSKEEYENALLQRNKLLSLEQLIHLRSFEQFEYSSAYDPDKALKKLQTLLKTTPIQPKKLSRIECYDISNLMQKEATASMVVATDGILDKAEYKRFKMKETGVSDFKMLTETLTRRLSNAWTQPDLIVVDGGSPQVIALSKLLHQLDKDIPLIGIAKHPDRIVILTNGSTKTYKFSLHNEGFKLIQQLRDESHRFAKKYHKFLRGRKFLTEVK